MRAHLLFVAVGLLGLLHEAEAYLVGPAVNLEKLSEEADIIFKATAVSSAAVEDAWFKPVTGFEAWETEFRVITVIKGVKSEQTLRFRHYDNSRRPPVFMAYQPQFYHFESGRSYLVFAKQTDTAGEFRQLWTHHTGKSDQGVLLCANDVPPASPGVREILWKELLALLQSPNAEDTIYGIRQIDQMSEMPDRYEFTKDFERAEVIKAVGGLLSHADPAIVKAAITVIGSDNPYLKDESAPYWLATVGSAVVPGLGKMDLNMKNLGGERYWQELIRIADGKAPAETRALAIRSLGRVRNPALLEAVSRWLADTEPAVRASATLLLTDFPQDDTLKHLPKLAADAAPEVRMCAAYGIGYIQRVELAGTLGTLLTDPDAKVRRAASLSLLSFSPKHHEVEQVFRANLDNEEFSPLFLNALAGEQPEAYLEPLAQVVEQKTEPKNWPGGEIPAFTAWNILFRYLQTQPARAIREGTFDRHLDALEKGYSTGSAEQRDLYAFYLQRDMTDRARAYRAAAQKAVSYDLNQAFNMVDQNPAGFMRQ
jgi:HEAT repeat protein